MNHILHFNSNAIEGRISLPSSKSISNRLLIIQALSGNGFNINNLSDSDDTNYLKEALSSDGGVVYIGHAGTAMRFLSAYFAAIGKDVVLTGSRRMQERPIRPLVDALNALGAEISYAKEKGFPPVRTGNKSLTGNSISIDADISSQFISALLLVAPALKEGLSISLKGDMVSSSYVDMTLKIMEEYGAEVLKEANTIKISHTDYSGMDCTVESDWSGASYWYSVAALADKTDIFLEGLRADSVQGDSEVAVMFEQLGVKSVFEEGGVRLCKTESKTDKFEMDFINQPDLIQTFVVCLCLTGIPFNITGAQTLIHKETDRILALQNEMLKLGYIIENPEPGILLWTGEKTVSEDVPCIETYNDHRMALAFAPAAIKLKSVKIMSADVVTKSYAGFWKDLQGCGFEITEG